MLKIPQQIAIQRWDTLPDILREALFDDRNTQIVAQIAAAQHLSDDKRKAVSRIAGYVMMGFLHPEDAAQEIKEATGIDPRIADTIAGSLNSKIFSPLRGDIDKMYTSPIEKAQEAPKPPTRPVMLEATEKPPLNDVLEKIKSVPMERVLMTGVPPMPPPGSSPKIAPQPVNFPIIEKEAAKPMMSSPKTPLVGFPTPVPKPSVPPGELMLGAIPQPPKSAGPVGATMPQAGGVVPAPKPSIPAPIMLHQEVAIAPRTNTPVVRSGNLVSRNLIENKPGPAAPPPPPPVAHLEFENKEKAKPRIVNYSAENITLPPKPSTPMAAPSQGLGTPAPATTSPTPPKTSAGLPADVPATPPKLPLPMQSNMPAMPPPATTPAPNLASAPSKSIPHLLDLSPKPPPPDIK